MHIPPSAVIPLLVDMVKEVATRMPPERPKAASTLGQISDLSHKAAFLQKFVRTQQSRIKRNSRAAAWTRDVHATNEQIWKTERELQQLMSDMQANGTVHSAFCQEWAEQERQSQISLHELTAKCNAAVAEARAGCEGVSPAQLAEHNVRCGKQLEECAWDLGREMRQLQDDLEIADSTIPQWWLRMRLQVQQSVPKQKSAVCEPTQHTGNSAVHPARLHVVGDAVEDSQGSEMSTSAASVVSLDHDDVRESRLDDDTEIATETQCGTKDSSQLHADLEAENWLTEADASAQKLIQRYELAGDKVCKQVHEAFIALHENFVHAMLSLMDRRATSCGALPHGWNAQESFTFQVNVRQTLNSAPNSASRTDILEAVQRLMPTKSMEQLKSMHVHVSNESQWWARLQELKQKWIRQSEAVESECRAMLEQSVSAHVNHAGFCAEVVKVEVDRCRLATTCTIEQEEKQQQKLSRDLEESAKRAREQSRLQHCQESQRLRQETNKTLVQEYSYYRKQLAMQHEKSQSDEVEMAKHHNRPAKLLNSQRVQYRKQQLARKQEEALQQEELLAIEERQREQRMERIRSLVQVEVKVDKERVFQPTKSLMTEAYKQSSLFRDRHGYTQEQVTSDKRYRVMEMLKAKGVLHKPYARDLISKIHHDGATAQRQRNMLVSKIDCLAFQ